MQLSPFARRVKHLGPYQTGSKARGGLPLFTSCREEVFSETHPLRWCGCQSGFFFPVAQAASCQGDNHQRQRPRGDRKVQIAAEHAGSGKELDQGRTIKGVPRSVYQDGHEHAALRVVEEPLYDETEGDKSEGKPNEVEDGTPRRYIRKILGGDQESRRRLESFPLRSIFLLSLTSRTY